jgi:uncharacterized protein YigE (DUF2233 family)
MNARLSASMTVLLLATARVAPAGESLTFAMNASPTHEYRNASPIIATQSGPMLVDRGLIPDIPAFRRNSTSRFVRNGVCAPTPQSAAFAISEGPVTFFEFAQFFRDHLGCRNALYLDGSVSSLYAPQFERADDHAKLGPIFAVTR